MARVVVLAEADRQNLTLTTLDIEALERHPPIETEGHEHGRDELGSRRRPAHVERTGRRSTSPGGARSAELHTFLHGGGAPSERALRELLALQSSDWAFLAHREWAAIIQGSVPAGTLPN